MVSEKQHKNQHDQQFLTPIFSKMAEQLDTIESATSTVSSLTTIAPVLENSSDLLEKELQLLKEKKREVEGILESLEQNQIEINEQKANIHQEIDRTLAEFGDILRKRISDLVKSLDDHVKQKLTELETQRINVHKILAQICSCLADVEQRVKSEKELLMQVQQVTIEVNQVPIQPCLQADLELVDIEDHQLQEACKELGEIVSDNTVYSKNCSASGNGSKFAIAGKQASLEVQLITKRGSECLQEVIPTAVLVNSKSGQEIHCEVVPCEESSGRYKITYQPHQRGKYSLHIRVNGRHIQGSPYPIAVTPSLESLSTPNSYRVVDGLKGPCHTATNSKRQIILSEFNGHKVRVIALERLEFINEFGELGTEDGQFNQPSGVAVDEQDNIYIADDDNNRIQKFKPDGRFHSKVGSEQAGGKLQFYYPLGIYFNRTDHCLYVCDQGNKRIQVITTDLEFVRFIGDGLLQEPKYVAFDDSNNLYVTDSASACSNHRVLVFTDKGHLIRTIRHATQLKQPYGIAIDSNNIVYVSETSQKRISMFTTDGDFIASFGEQGQFQGIKGLNIGENDSLLVSDNGNNRLLIFED